MLFVETPVFTRELQTLLPDDVYSSLQLALMFRPEAGAVISGGAGVRKIRWSLPGKGKRGGVRVIYYWQRSEEVIYMLWIYPKSRQEDLTQEQLRMMRRYVKENLK
jgi:hypothetical protein